MAKISLICEQCGGNIMLDDSHIFGTCEHCYAQFIINKDIVVQNNTKNVYGIEGKDIEELMSDAYKLINLGDDRKANVKFRQALNIEPNCWSAWLGYASTGGDRNEYLSIVPAYRKAYSVAIGEEQELETFVDMVRYLPDKHLRSVFIRGFNIASQNQRLDIFNLVSGVIGCDESEIASLAIDLCPYDWRAYFAMAKFRQIRVRWCELEGGFFTGKHLPTHAVEVLNLFIYAYRLSKGESDEAKEIVLSYINEMGRDNSYRVFANELKNKVQLEG